MLMSYHWKGEIRELENVIERAVIFCDTEYLQPEQLPENLYPRTGQKTTFFTGEQILRDAVRWFERLYIERMLGRYNLDKKKTADALGVCLSSLYRKMDDLGISVK